MRRFHFLSILPHASVTFAATPLVGLPLACADVLTLGRGASLDRAAALAGRSMSAEGMRLSPNCMGDRKDAVPGDSILGGSLLPGHVTNAQIQNPANDFLDSDHLENFVHLCTHSSVPRKPMHTHLYRQLSRAAATMHCLAPAPSATGARGPVLETTSCARHWGGPRFGTVRRTTERADFGGCVCRGRVSPLWGRRGGRWGLLWLRPRERGPEGVTSGPTSSAPEDSCAEMRAITLRSRCDAAISRSGDCVACGGASCTRPQCASQRMPRCKDVLVAACVWRVGLARASRVCKGDLPLNEPRAQQNMKMPRATTSTGSPCKAA